MSASTSTSSRWIARSGRSPRPIGEFLQKVGFWGHGIKTVMTNANCQPAFGYYRKDPNADVYRATGIIVLSVAGEQVSALTRFGDKGLMAGFGLPRTLFDA